MLLTRIFRYKHLPELILAAVAISLSGLIVYRIYNLGEIKTMVDQNSHLNLARQMIDSMTPGFSQIGFWPPLLHILMVPYVASDFLYRTGLAGFFTLVPFLVMASVYLYKTINLLIKNKLIAFVGTLAFIMNPYVLYYTATPMMEILFMGNLFACAYYITRWLIYGQLKDVLIGSAFITVATVSRFEGLFLIPVVGMIIVAKLIVERKTYQQIEGMMIIFSLLATAGFIILLSYGYIYGKNPLSFMNGAWSAFNQQRDYYLPTQNNLANSLKYIMHASYHLMSNYYVLVAVMGFPFLMFFGSRLILLSSALIFFSPFIFDFVAMFRGNAIVYVPELPPYGTFFNERYGLYWAGFIFLVPTVIIGLIYLKSKQTKFSLLASSISGLLLSVMLMYSGYYLYKTAFVDNYSIVKRSAQGYPSREQIQLARTLESNYDYGKVLMTRALHDFVAVDAKIPLKDYIHESNYKYFDQALHDPWLFARYVVMFNPDAQRQDKWAAKNELVSVKWGNSPKFHKYYSLVMQNDRERLYKINEEAVREYVLNLNYDVNKIPSLNRNISWWDPDKIYLAFNDND